MQHMVANILKKVSSSRCSAVQSWRFMISPSQKSRPRAPRDRRIARAEYDAPSTIRGCKLHMLLTTCESVCQSKSASACMCVCALFTCVRMQKCSQRSACLLIPIYAPWLNAYMFICIYIYIRVCVNIHVHACINIDIHMCSCILTLLCIVTSVAVPIFLFLFCLCLELYSRSLEKKEHQHKTPRSNFQLDGPRMP